MRGTSDIPEVSFFREGAPDREPRDLVTGFFDGALDRLLLSLPSFEGDSHHVPRRVDINVGDVVELPQGLFDILKSRALFPRWSTDVDVYIRHGWFLSLKQFRPRLHAPV
jgi:hypothetical protein